MLLTRTTTRGWAGAFLITVPATTVMGMFTGGFAGSRVGGAAIGLVVGALLGVIAVPVSRVARVADAAVLLAGLVTGIRFGGGVLAQLWMNRAWIEAPPSSFYLLQPPIGDGLNVFFILFNTLMEFVLLPAALYLNWRVPGRRALVVAAALIFYGMRVWTYVYFVPEIISLGMTPVDRPATADLAARAQRWVDLSWYRVAIDGLANLAFFLAAFALGRPQADSGRSAGQPPAVAAAAHASAP